MLYSQKNVLFGLLLSVFTVGSILSLSDKWFPKTSSSEKAKKAGHILLIVATSISGLVVTWLLGYTLYALNTLAPLRFG